MGDSKNTNQNIPIEPPFWDNRDSAQINQNTFFMIVANMNLHEVYQNLTEEIKKVNWKRDTLFAKAAKEMRRQGSFPAWVMYDYKIPASNNQYVIYFYAEHPYGRIIGDSLCVVYDDNKRYVIKWTNTRIPEIHVFTSHFLQRYKERFLGIEELTANEVAVRYLTRNDVMKAMAIDERINRHVDKYGEYAAEGFLVRDGFCFKLSGEEKKDDGTIIRISMFTTFMPTADLSETQRRAIFEECLRDVG